MTRVFASALSTFALSALLLNYSKWSFAADSTYTPDYIPVKRISNEQFKAKYSGPNRPYEGWVVCSVQVDTEGNVEDVIILDSSGATGIERAFVDFLSKQQYSPALLKGEPVRGSYENKLIQFTDMDRGVSRRVRALFRDGREAIVAGDAPAAQKIVEKLQAIDGRNLYEEAHIELLKASRYRLLGQQANEVHSLSRILRFDTYGESEDMKNRYLEQDLQLQVLSRLYEIQMNNMMIADAQNTASKLTQLTPDNPITLQIEKHAQMVMSHLPEDATIRTTGELADNPYRPTSVWKTRLSRKRGFIDQTEGSITNFKIACDNGETRADPTGAISWNLPDSWGTCTAELIGEPGTTFELVQEPDQ